ncbi:MAG: oruR2 [Myxococcaceae bacterium]|nr:oruR2 [Myxococcaceae bacterium]
MKRIRGAHLTKTASTLVLRWLLAYARRDGLDVAGLLRGLRIAPTELDDPDVRVPEPTMQRAWAEIVAASTDEAFGLHLAQHTEEGQFEVLDYAVSFSATVRDALHRVAQFYRLVSDAVAIQVLRDGAATRVVRVVGGTDPQDQDAFFALLVERFRNISGRPIRPREVSFAHPPHAQRDLAAFFRCPVHFMRARSELVFASSDLELPVRAAKPQLATLLDRYAAELLARLPATGTYADHVRRVVEQVIGCGAPTLEAISRELRASPRTVQRRLSDAGTTHTRVVDDVRRQLAVRYLESPRLSITEIAFLLGYEDDSSFRRAFKKWTGKSPTQTRHRSTDAHRPPI